MVDVLGDMSGSEHGAGEFGIAEASKLYNWSFFLSQNNEAYQEQIFRYLHLTHPNWHVDESFRVPLRDGAQRMVRSLQDKGMHSEVTGDQMQNDAESPFDRMIQVFSEPVPEDVAAQKQEVLREVMIGIVKKDLRVFPLWQSVRPRSEAYKAEMRKNTGPSLFDHRLSHFCYFILAGEKINIPEYDAMLAEIRANVQGMNTMDELKAALHNPTDDPNNEVGNSVDWIMELYNGSYPDAQVILPFPSVHEK